MNHGAASLMFDRFQATVENSLTRAFSVANTTWSTIK